MCASVRTSPTRWALGGAEGLSDRLAMPLCGPAPLAWAPATRLGHQPVSPVPVPMQHRQATLSCTGTQWPKAGAELSTLLSHICWTLTLLSMALLPVGRPSWPVSLVHLGGVRQAEVLVLAPWSKYLHPDTLGLPTAPLHSKTQRGACAAAPELGAWLRCHRLRQRYGIPQGPPG